ncbi:MAG: hypothetical protein FWE90_08735 [Defluviitaleaceae bacterium]|nr:hypothetical protein [Defluviitaleaceae bacterium]
MERPSFFQPFGSSLKYKLLRAAGEEQTDFIAVAVVKVNAFDTITTPSVT